MKLPLSTPERLIESPELAAVEILDHAVEVARRALFAAFPNLTCAGSFTEDPGITPQDCLAVALLTALDTLAESIEHYRVHLDALASRQTVRLGVKSDINF